MGEGNSRGVAKGKMGGRCVLVVDDEEMVLETVTAMLEALGMTTLSAKSGQEALTQLESNRARIDAVIMDVMMPGLNGIETAQRMLEGGFENLMVLSTGYSEVEVPEALGARVQLLKKPYRLDSLREILG